MAYLKCAHAHCKLVWHKLPEMRHHYANHFLRDEGCVRVSSIPRTINPPLVSYHERQTAPFVDSNDKDAFDDDIDYNNGTLMMTMMISDTPMLLLL
uniref:Uncharacterized protein n=1 Tax=Glossina palpalis gambiensis TaxID=67801 RepID=A0A1B0C5J3_9MUSC